MIFCRWLVNLLNTIQPFPCYSNIYCSEFWQRNLLIILMSKQKSAQAAGGCGVKKQTNTMKEEFELFYGPKCTFSQFHPATFKVDGITYNCMEQYMHHQKAVTFNDKVREKEIMKTSDPKMHKKLGRKVENFDKVIWGQRSVAIVRKGSLAKYRQNPEMKKILFATYPKTLVEASPRDRLWGIGLGRNNPKALNRATWRGKNLLGETLTEVRNKLMLEERAVGEAAGRTFGHSDISTSDLLPEHQTSSLDVETHSYQKVTPQKTKTEKETIETPSKETKSSSDSEETPTNKRKSNTDTGETVTSSKKRKADSDKDVSPSKKRKTSSNMDDTPLKKRKLSTNDKKLSLKTGKEVIDSKGAPSKKKKDNQETDEKLTSKDNVEVTISEGNFLPTEDLHGEHLMLSKKVEMPSSPKLKHDRYSSSSKHKHDGHSSPSKHKHDGHSSSKHKQDGHSSPSKHKQDGHSSPSKHKQDGHSLPSKHKHDGHSSSKHKQDGHSSPSKHKQDCHSLPSKHKHDGHSPSKHKHDGHSSSKHKHDGHSSPKHKHDGHSFLAGSVLDKQSSSGKHQESTDSKELTTNENVTSKS